MKRHKLHHAWLILAAYGVWFAVLSGAEEISHGKIWKAALSLLLGIISYFIIESKFERKKF